MEWLVSWSVSLWSINLVYDNDPETILTDMETSILFLLNPIFYLIVAGDITLKKNLVIHMWKLSKKVKYLFIHFFYQH